MFLCQKNYAFKLTFTFFKPPCQISCFYMVQLYPGIVCTFWRLAQYMRDYISVNEVTAKRPKCTFCRSQNSQKPPYEGGIWYKELDVYCLRGPSSLQNELILSGSADYQIELKRNRRHYHCFARRRSGVVIMWSLQIQILVSYETFREQERVDLVSSF